MASIGSFGLSASDLLYSNQTVIESASTSSSLILNTIASSNRSNLFKLEEAIVNSTKSNQLFTNSSNIQLSSTFLSQKNNTIDLASSLVSADILVVKNTFIKYLTKNNPTALGTTTNVSKTLIYEPTSIKFNLINEKAQTLIPLLPKVNTTFKNNFIRLIKKLISKIMKLYRN